MIAVMSRLMEWQLRDGWRDQVSRRRNVARDLGWDIMGHFIAKMLDGSEQRGRRLWGMSFGLC
jgi:hypothetical protein